LVIIKAVYFNFWIAMLKMYVRNNFLGSKIWIAHRCLIRNWALRDRKSGAPVARIGTPRDYDCVQYDTFCVIRNWKVFCGSILYIMVFVFNFTHFWKGSTTKSLSGAVRKSIYFSLWVHLSVYPSVGIISPAISCEPRAGTMSVRFDRNN
jgi:hypothetical protein